MAGQKPKLSIREIVAEDASFVNQYWADNTDDDLVRMGEAARPDAQGSIDFINQFCSERLPPDRAEEGLLIWELDGKPIGYCSLKEIRCGNDAQIHLHMWERNLRGKGVGAGLFCLSALKFIKEFKLRTLYCQPKHDNPMPNRMLKKIGCALLSKVDWKHPGNGSIVRQNQYLVSEGVIHKYLDSIRGLFAFQRETK